jgi:O-antigen ligase
VGRISQTVYPKSQALSQIFSPDIPNFPASRASYSLLHSADWAALVLVGLALLATLAADNFGASMREWRVVVFESVLFYFLVRLGSDFSPPPPGSPGEAETSPEQLPAGWRWAWRLVNAFVAGAVVQALIALFLYFFTDRSITAEGVQRAIGLAYGSPNNLSLFLDRAWPILLAVALFPGASPDWPSKTIRWLYGAGLVVVSLALYLTFSKGALLLGLPAGLLAMVLLYVVQHRQGRWRRALLIAVGGIAAIGLALIPLSRTARFQTLFDFNQGSTGFFRLKLWQAAWAMVRDHWLLGIGLDNFLYQYRTRYILPEAWQEPNLSHPHNLILDFGTRLGIGGIVLLVWLQVTFWLNAWRLYLRQPDPLVLGLMGSMVVFISHGLVDNSYFLVDLAFTFFLTVGLVQRLGEQADY